MTSPAPISHLLPSSSLPAICPERQYPTWCFWHEFVPAIDFMSLDHFHPGMYVVLVRVRSLTLATSTFAFGGDLVSSGFSNLFF